MSDVEWDAEDFDPQSFSKAEPAVTDRWEGEDDDEDTKDAWDAEEEEGGAEGSQNTAAVSKKKKKSLKEIIAEKEAKKQEELEKKKQEMEEKSRKLTPEEIVEEKLRQQKLQEDSDLEIAKSTLGLTNDAIAGRTGALDTFEPISKEDFDKYSKMLQERISTFERSTFYVGFLETLYRELALDLEVDDVKKLSACLTALYNEKNKAAKSLKGKKKTKGKANLNPGKDDNYEDYTGGALDDYDDFM